MKHSRVFGPSRPPTGSESQMERTIRNRSRSPPSSANRQKSHSMREPWMTEIGEDMKASKPGTFHYNS